MSAPDEPGSWRAVEIGPGGIPAERISPRGPGAPPSASVPPQPWDAAAGRPRDVSVPPWGPASDRLSHSPRTPPWDPPRAGEQLWQQWSQPHEPDRARPWFVRPLVLRLVGGLAAVALVIGLAVWAKANGPLSSAGNVSRIAVGDCLEASGQRITGEVPCGGGAADFSVVGRYPDTSDASNCSATPSDVAVVGSGPAVLCLDYIAVVGDCLLAGDRAAEVGKVDCSSDLTGVYRVEAVLHNTIDPTDCPKTTRQTLVHRFNSEVLCLGQSS
ncbi:hypothetical protein ABIB25_001322 [Nakamurella sp. UYEF19]|uniref:LppU/SCO3897 family protein n=1 Tax=Nakamurella sp. UYEF19 TaxID=1756392 RepID=UPI003391E5D6